MDFLEGYLTISVLLPRVLQLLIEVHCYEGKTGNRHGWFTGKG